MPLCWKGIKEDKSPLLPHWTLLFNPINLQLCTYLSLFFIIQTDLYPYCQHTMLLIHVVPAAAFIGALPSCAHYKKHKHCWCWLKCKPVWYILSYRVTLYLQHRDIQRKAFQHCRLLTPGLPTACGSPWSNHLAARHMCTFALRALYYVFSLVTFSNNIVSWTGFNTKHALD